jgi:DtxR family Mn-dependent transcriptional regulator
MFHPPVDEALEKLWYAKEEGRTDDVPSELIEQKLATAAGLTPEGEERARGIVRRHRLAEVMFKQVMDADLQDAEKSACEFEHILAERVVDRVCTFLGHPPACPHGKPIPQGSCCRVYSRKIEPLITRLIDVPIGAKATVVFIAPKFVHRLNRLAAFGVVPGSEVRLIERRPSLVLSCGQTSLALEDEIGAEIYVRLVA